MITIHNPSDEWIVMVILRGSLTPLVFLRDNQTDARRLYLEYAVYRANVVSVYLARIWSIEHKDMM